MQFIKSIYLNNRLFFILMGFMILFGIAFIFPFLYNAALYLLLFLGILTGLDILFLYIHPQGITASRTTPEKLSNGDENPVNIHIYNHYGISIICTVIDEIPYQFQVRDFNICKTLSSHEQVNLQYHLRPTERGEYFFGHLNIYAKTPLGLASRRYRFDFNHMVPNYPSYIQLRKYDLMAFSNHIFQYGVKRIRKIGHTMEFEQIKDYVTGDDIRTINWKATAKKNALMVNQFQDEKSQNIYMIIDKGRLMKMPFEGLSLLDYSINATLVLSNIILKKQDKAGMMAFSKKIDNRVVSNRKSNQMQLILQNLYNISTDFFESDFSKLYVDIKKNIAHRSLIMLYTNFETLESLHRQLPYLKGIAKNHLLVVIFFENSELNDMIRSNAQTLEQIYDKTIAEKFAYEKKLIANELRKYGIYVILTPPNQLTVDSINTYLEIKARGIL